MRVEVPKLSDTLWDVRTGFINVSIMIGKSETNTKMYDMRTNLLRTHIMLLYNTLDNAELSLMIQLMALANGNKKNSEKRGNHLEKKRIAVLELRRDVKRIIRHVKVDGKAEQRAVWLAAMKLWHCIADAYKLEGKEVTAREPPKKKFKACEK